MIPDADQTEEVSPLELRALLESGAVRLVDCREEDEFTLCRIGGATLVPLGQIPDKLEQVCGVDGRPVVVYCHHGMRSLHAVRFLRARGVERSFSLRGGIDAWSESVDPLVPKY